MRSPGLTLSRDRKVAPLGVYDERWKRWIPSVANSFGLPSVVTCPGRTAFCESCYAGNSEGMPSVLTALQRNHQLLLEAGTTEAMAELLRVMVGRFWRRCTRPNRGGTPLLEHERVFRIHWDGDFFSLDYARAWAVVIAEFPGVRFWCYTRSFVEPVDVVPVLVGLPNLALYLSTDEGNVDAALEHWIQHDHVQLALCGTDYTSARALVPEDVGAMVCPENGSKPGYETLMVQPGVGACVKCQLCPTGKRSVIFSTSHQEVAVTIRGGP